MKISDITNKIEAFAPLALQESYDNAGLIVGRYNDEIQGGVLLAVDVNFVARSARAVASRVVAVKGERVVVYAVPLFICSNR